MVKLELDDSLGEFLLRALPTPSLLWVAGSCFAANQALYTRFGCSKEELASDHAGRLPFLDDEANQQFLELVRGLRIISSRTANSRVCS
jgi:hypothetical protein